MGQALTGLSARASGPGSGFQLDRILAGVADEPREAWRRNYVASAVVTLFSVPLVAKGGVGGGHIEIVERAGGTVAIEFSAGSWPESARGLNRLGFIREAVTEGNAGTAAECAYLAFMTTSDEKNLDQAKQAMSHSGAQARYTAAQGFGRGRDFEWRVDRLSFPSFYTSRHLGELIPQARAAMSARESQPLERCSCESPDTATFLYTVRRALFDGPGRTARHLIFNGKEFLLETTREADPGMAQVFAARHVIAKDASVTRLKAMLTERRSGVKTPFQLWFENGAECEPPLRFDYQARPYLRLAFEAQTNQKPART